LAIVVLSLAVPAFAEEPPALAAGSRVRIRTSEGRGGLATAVSLILFTPALTATGALVGLALPPPDRWVTVPSTPPVRPSGPSPLGLRLTLRF
jgi:hypothetical protein